jgi:hypothetical protein
MNPLLLIAGVVAVYFATKGKGSASGGGNASGKRQALINWNRYNTNDSPASIQTFEGVLNRMTDDEIVSTYDFIFNYANKGIRVPEGSALYYAIAAISNKYNIFT